MRKVAILSILLIGFLVRFHNYWIVPTSDETKDEIFWTWLGSSLIKDGQPRAWSYFDAYRPNYIFQEGLIDPPIVSPNLDQPPLFSFIPGIAHLISQDNWNTIPSRKVIRFPMIILGTLNVLMLYLVARKFFDENWVLVTVVIYATMPLIVLSSRLVVSENLLVFWSLLLFLLVTDWKKGQANSWKKVVMLVVSSAAVLTKIHGLVLPVTLLLSGIYLKEKDLIKLGTISLIISFSILLIYFGWFDFSLFLAVQCAQASRDVGLTTIFQRFFLHPVVARFIFMDGFLVMGIFSSILMSLKDWQRKENINYFFWFVQFCLLLMFILLSSGEFTYHGWYSYVLFPYFALAITYILQNYKKNSGVIIALFWILWLPTFNNFLFQTGTNLLSNIWIVRFIYTIGFLPLLSRFFGERYLKNTAISILIFVIIVNCLSVININETSWRVQHNNYEFNFMR